MTDNSQYKEEILLGIDYGESNIGLAFGRKNLSMPLKIISGKDIDRAISDISRVVLENKVSRIILGLPLNEEGKETLEAKKVRRFANLLKRRVKKPVDFIDEYESSKGSLEEALKTGISKKRRRDVDDLAAAIILKKYYRQISSS